MKETDKQVDSGQCHIFCVENSVKLYKQNNYSVIGTKKFLSISLCTDWVSMLISQQAKLLQKSRQQIHMSRMLLWNLMLVRNYTKFMHYCRDAECCEKRFWFRKILCIFVQACLIISLPSIQQGWVKVRVAAQGGQRERCLTKGR